MTAVDQPTAIPDARRKESLLATWATPIYQRYHGEAAAPINRDLLKFIFEREVRDKSLSLGVFNARKSSQDLLQSNVRAVAKLRAWVLDAIIAMNEAVIGPDSRALDDDIIAEAWAVVYRDDGYHKIHTHHDAAWSGVYYVSVGDMERGSGKIQFIDPRPAALATSGVGSKSVFSLDPEPGLLVAFPSWLPHSVTTVKCVEPRVCIAFNATFSHGGMS